MSLIPSREFGSASLPSMPFDMDFSNDGKLLACATTSDGGTAPILHVLPLDGTMPSATYDRATAESCQGVAFLARGEELVFLLKREDGTTELLRTDVNCEDPEQLHYYEPTARNHSIVRNEAATRFAVLGTQAEIWDAATGKVMRAWPVASGGYPVHAAFSRDGSHFYAYGTVANTVVRYHVESGQETGRWQAPTPFGAQVLITPDERFLLVAGESYSGAFIYDLERGERLMSDPDEIVTFDEHQTCRPWATSPDSSLLVCQLLGPWSFRLPDLYRLTKRGGVTFPGTRCLSAAWAWNTPVVAFGTLEDATVRWFPLIEAEVDVPEADSASKGPNVPDGADGGPSPTSSGER
jgi:hypothetical protein